MTEEATKCVEALRKCPDPNYNCNCCPVYVEGKSCQNELVAANLIESLSVQLDEAQTKLTLVTKERNAAVSDMERLQGLICQVCQEYYQPDPTLRKWACKIYGSDWGEISENGILACGKFKWRGVQAEDTA